MATFKQILKEKRQSDQGILSSIGAAALGSTLEKVDPRNYLFKSGSMFNALFPKVKGYQATRDRTKKLSTSPSSLLASNEVSMLSEKLDSIGKNTLAIPTMARDMFLVKENIIKLVKIQGGTPRTKSGDWFSRQLARETAYEARFEKKDTSPEKVGAKDQKDKGFMTSMLGFLTGFLGEGLLSMLIRGGLLVGILASIGKYFEKPEFRETVNKLVGGIFSVISDSLKAVFGEDIWSNLTTGILAVTAALASYKFAIEALKTGFLALELGALKASSKLGLAGLLGALGPIIALGGVAYGLWKLIKSDSKMTSTYDQYAEGGGWTPDMSSTTTTEPMTTDEMISGIRPGGLAGLKDEQKKDKEKQPITPSSTTPSKVPSISFNDLTEEQQTQFLLNQAKAEGFFDPTKNTVAKRHNNPGNIIAKSPTEVYPAQAKFGGVPGETITDKDGKTRTFVRFPTEEAGFAAQKDLWKRKYGDKPLSESLKMWVDPSSRAEMMNYEKVTLSGLVGTPKIDGPAISSKSTQVNDERLMMTSGMIPSIIDAKTINNVQQGNQSMGGGAMPSVVDSDFMRYLVNKAAS